ncbi:SMP-30/gluconolactonase/LRE family protein [Calidifontibacter sp. DB0510]|uniref:SMP-30/gluconolactonase/LRE family protein n=1 Tax=Metallococcus carri TaxID=1656884 RepID=A0A967B3N1_9MICO|nr:SMP-30/gluconolactonase/LRE family protein [Metallococcus carri]NHN56765.1 SMP-30/gluconolactonase/LRE family protein [Metallococcus carri]NOP37858.1 SMP-30/gluconolactonase/LRE family protein [Calidifontibacter sp. DB2511S]
MRAEPIAAPHAFHAEGPVWFTEWGGLKYVDLLAGDVLTVRDDGGVDRVHVGTIAAAIRPRGGGGAIVALERGIALSDDYSLRELRTLPPLWDDTSVRFNDGGCDPAGNFWVGSMAYDQRTGGGTLWQVTPDATSTPRVTDVTISNGIGWSPDGRTAFYIDTPTRTIWAFDWSPETGLTGRRPWVRLDDSVKGSPDGLWVDAEGGVWVALYGGSAVHRYDSGGVLSEVVDLPCTNVTACTFGDRDNQTLFITTSREGLAPYDQPLAGAVFSCRPGVYGMPTLPFAG